VSPPARSISSPISFLDASAIIVSVLSLIIAIWAALSSKRQADSSKMQADEARKSYDLALQQHQQTLFSNVIIYSFHDKYDLQERQFMLGIANAGQVPVASARINVLHNSSEIYSSIVPILFQQQSKSVELGESLHNYLGKIGAFEYTPAGYIVKEHQPIIFRIEGFWIPSVMKPFGKEDMLKLQLEFCSESKAKLGKSSTFTVRLRNVNG